MSTSVHYYYIHKHISYTKTIFCYEILYHILNHFDVIICKHIIIQHNILNYVLMISEPRSELCVKPKRYLNGRCLFCIM